MPKFTILYIKEERSVMMSNAESDDEERATD